ncbi:MAG TPA: hypothetical protein VGH91_13710 [Gammaproteobacteria bacterium]|jgi:hypothetical protein
MAIISGLLYAASAARAAAPAPVQDAQARSAQAFVQGFYDWYAWEAQKQDEGPIGAALKSKRWPSSAAIVSALKADEEAQAKSPDEVVGIDFDPYLNAQDSCFPYKAGKVTASGGQYRVEVFDSNCSDPHPEQPTVIAVLEKDGASWRFTNFIYPGEPGQADSDLLATLKQLQQERSKPAD